jgi:predicted ABC-type ATPase
VAGPNGAGKTTVTEQGLAHEWFGGCEYVNPDLIAERELGNWNDPRLVLQAANLAAERREACLRDGRSLALETVFSAPDKLDFTLRAKAAGYFIRVFFVGTQSPEINAARIARRVLEGGHEVPIRKIIDRWARSIANAATIAPDVDRFYLYDNSVDDREAQLVVRAADGRLERQYAEPPAWAAPSRLAQRPCIRSCCIFWRAAAGTTGRCARSLRVTPRASSALTTSKAARFPAGITTSPSCSAATPSWSLNASALFPLGLGDASPPSAPSRGLSATSRIHSSPHASRLPSISLAGSHAAHSATNHVPHHAARSNDSPSSVERIRGSTLRERAWCLGDHPMKRIS